MFETLSRSWRLAKTSYAICWANKRLLILPVLSAAAAILVSLSFTLPLANADVLKQMPADIKEGGGRMAAWIFLTFAFYFCNYFVIVFFNSALIACAMQVVRGEEPRLKDGLAVAATRLPQILGWAAVSAVIGVLLKLIENMHEKAGQIIAAILGNAWTALTYFAVPFLVMEGVGPFKAIKRSIGTLREHWGTSLVANFSIGLINFLIMLPVLILCGLVFMSAVNSGSETALVLAIVLCVALIGLCVALASAADIVLKAVLYNYATGQMIPQDVDASEFDDAFASKE